MERIDHLEHLDRHLVDELAQVARETIREELREQTRKQRRTAVLYAASGAVALYAGAAVAVAIGLALGIGLPNWAAALITAAILGVAAYLLRNAAKPHAARHQGVGGPAAGAAQPSAPTGVPYPPMPPVAPATPVPEPGRVPGAEAIDPENPHHRG